MASLERLTKRVKKMEDWVKENEDVGGPKGVLDTFSFLINEARGSSQVRMQLEQEFNKLRTYAFEFIKNHEMTEEWDEFIREKETNAVQKQQTEEIPIQEEAEDGEEVGEEDSEGKKPSKKSNKEKKD